MRHQRRDASFTVITNNHNRLLFPHDNEKAPLRMPQTADKVQSSGIARRRYWTAPQKLDTQLSKVQFYG